MYSFLLALIYENFPYESHRLKVIISIFPNACFSISFQPKLLNSFSDLKSTPPTDPPCDFRSARVEGSYRTKSTCDTL